MKYLVSILLLAPLFLVAQTKEFSFGTNFSNYFWFNNNTLNTNEYLPGAQLGFMWGNKEDNLFGKQKRLQLAFGISYNLAQIGSTNQRPSSLSFIEGREVHSFRATVPVRFIFNRKSKVNIFIEGAPGVSLIMYQNHDKTNGIQDRIPPLDLFIQAGVGVKVDFLKEEYKKGGYKFSGFTFSGSRYISIDPIRSNNVKVGILDQILFDVGLRFSYVKKKKRWFQKKNH